MGQLSQTRLQQRNRCADRHSHRSRAQGASCMTASDASGGGLDEDTPTRTDTGSQINTSAHSVIVGGDSLEKPKPPGVEHRVHPARRPKDSQRPGTGWLSLRGHASSDTSRSERTPTPMTRPTPNTLQTAKQWRRRGASLGPTLIMTQKTTVRKSHNS